ncbi:recombinase family protein [Effusibacillus pohliae]|uniref:recombinase family protein n=1 Tax=Effusibacillus pohliae TaxID=232270 RepID=UPI0003721F6E|nr:recombinase family protein [Effusibacillus pohliae]
MRAAIYTRVSSNMQAEDGFSLEAQHDILMELLERKGLELYRVYSDPGVSGKTFKRPGVQAMIADMKAGRFEALLIHKLDRLSRNLGDLYAFVELINKLDVRLIIAAQGTEEIDTRSPMGKAFLFFSGIWAQIYLENLREETLKGLTKKAQKGGKHMSRPPLGYTFDDRYNLVVVEEEAKLVREVFDLYLNRGWGVTKIAKYMNEFSTTKEGGKWDNKSVRNVLTNPTYAGYNHFKPAHWPEESRILTEGQHVPLVSKEDFERVKQFRSRRAAGYMSRRSFIYAYSGIVKCGQCGATYAGNTSVHNGREYRSYRCLNQYAKKTCDAPSISERMLNQLVFDHLQLIDDGFQSKKSKKRNTQTDIQKEVEKSNRRRKNWMLALGDGKLSAEDYAMLIEEEDARMRALYEQIQDRPEPSIPVEELRKMMKSLKEDWDLIEPETQKQLIQSMFQKIVILKGKDGWEITDLLTV